MHSKHRGLTQKTTRRDDVDPKESRSAERGASGRMVSGNGNASFKHNVSRAAALMNNVRSQSRTELLRGTERDRKTIAAASAINRVNR